MRVLFCVNSYFQLIIATNLRITIYKDSVADIILYNSMQNVDMVFNNVKNSNVFNQVYLASGSLLFLKPNASKIAKFRKVFVYLGSMFLPTFFSRRSLGIKLTTKYDQFLFEAYGALTECLFNAMIKNNSKMVCYRIEDGVGTLITNYIPKSKFRSMFERSFSLLLNRKIIENYINGHYYLNPDIIYYKIPYPKLVVPPIVKNVPLVQEINRFFSYEYAMGKDYENAEVIYFDQHSSWDYDIVQTIIKVIPRDKLIVKLHPRRESNVYASMGVNVAGSSHIPWELIELNSAEKLHNKIFISRDSAALFWSETIFRNPCCKILLYKCKDYSPHNNSSLNHFIDNYDSKCGQSHFITPNTSDELIHILKLHYFKGA